MYRRSKADGTLVYVTNGLGPASAREEAILPHPAITEECEPTDDAKRYMDTRAVDAEVSSIVGQECPQPTYTLVYFAGLRGRAELPRLIMNFAGLEYNEKLLTIAEWEEMKEVAPMGELPILYVNKDKILCQSLAIARYLARECGILGADWWQQARADMLVDGILDLFNAYMKLAVGPAEELVQEEKWNKYYEEMLKPNLLLYESFLSETNTGWFVEDQLTWADIAVADFFGLLQESREPALLAEHPNLREHMEQIRNIPTLKNYILSRPSTIV